MKCISIYSYLLSIGKTNSSAISCNTNSSAQPIWTWKIALQNKNCMIKRGLEQKNCTVKKLQQIHDKKCFMCEWDHWNNIGVNPAWYIGEFAMSKSQWIHVMCVKALTQLGQLFQKKVNIIVFRQRKVCPPKCSSAVNNKQTNYHNL